MFETLLIVLTSIAAATLPLILVILYFRRFSKRKDQIVSLLEGNGGARLPETEVQRRRSKNELELDIRSYLYPIGIAGAFSAIGVLIILAKYTGVPAGLGWAHSIPQAAIAGFMGAYIWNLYELVDRFRILNLPVTTLHGIWFRLILGPALGMCAASFGLLGQPVFVFMLMAFPIPTLIKWIQDQASQKAGIASGPVGPALWELIQGLTPDVIIRLSEAGVSNLTHLANQDPISLLRRTNLEWRNVLDMMDQAYLAGYIGPAIEKWRAKGVRGAIEGAVLWARLDRGNQASQASAQSVIQSLAADLNTTDEAVKNLLRNLWEDPQVDLIWSLWFDRDNTIESEPERGQVVVQFPIDIGLPAPAPQQSNHTSPSSTGTQGNKAGETGESLERTQDGDPSTVLNAVPPDTQPAESTTIEPHI